MQKENNQKLLCVNFMLRATRKCKRKQFLHFYSIEKQVERDFFKFAYRWQQILHYYSTLKQKFDLILNVCTIPQSLASSTTRRSRTSRTSARCTSSPSTASPVRTPAWRPAFVSTGRGLAVWRK